MNDETSDTYKKEIEDDISLCTCSNLKRCAKCKSIEELLLITRLEYVESHPSSAVPWSEIRRTTDSETSDIVDG